MRENGILQILENSRYTVVLTGSGMLLESGYPLLRDGEESYEIENKYGYSYEENSAADFIRPGRNCSSGCIKKSCLVKPR